MQPLQLTAVNQDDVLFLPMRKRMVVQYAVGQAGTQSLHLFYDDKEITFDEPAFFAFGETLAAQSSFKAGDAAGWIEHPDWNIVRPLLEHLLAEGVIAHAPNGHPPAEVPADMVRPSPLAPATCTRPRDWASCEDITADDQKPKPTKTAQKPNSCDFYHKNSGNVKKFLCADGPSVGDACTAGNAKFTQDAYKIGGKYGELSSFKLTCYCDPTNGESVNASCCPISKAQKAATYGKTLTTTQQDGGNELYTPSKVNVFKSGETKPVTIDSIEALCGWGLSQLNTNFKDFVKNRSAICYEVNEKGEKGEVLGSVFEHEVDVYGAQKEIKGSGTGNAKEY